MSSGVTNACRVDSSARRVARPQQRVAADHQQLGSIDLGCRLAAYFESRIGSGQRCCWPLNAGPLGGADPVTNRERAAAVCYLAPAVLLLGFGLRYLTASEFMPYHAEGLERAWHELASNEQGVMLAALRGGGGGFLIGGVTILVLVALPFRRGEAWAFKALPCLVLLCGLSALYTALTLTLLTPASAPWPAALGAAALALVGFLLAPSPSRESPASPPNTS
jgi:hypothetical protein